MKIVFYAMNGKGAGHVVRVTTIAQAVRAQWHGSEPLQMCVLTTAEATDMLVEAQIPFFKFPSRVAIENTGLSSNDYIKLGADLISEALRFFQPDLLVVDTLPGGLFGELLPGAQEGASKYCRRRALIARPVRQSILDDPEYLDALAHYDQIIVPEEEKDCAFALPETVRDRVTFSGPVFSTAAGECINRAAVRERFGIADGTLTVLVSVGGGGHPDNERILRFALETLTSEAGVHAIVMAGPLYQGQVFDGPKNVTWLKGERTVRVLPGIDMAVSTAGYNSFNELMFNGIPTVFVTVPTRLDDQPARAERAVAAGAAHALTALDGETLRRIVSEWRDPARRGRAAKAAKTVVRANGAVRAACELLGLLGE